jgi:hypothetical protein
MMVTTSADMMFGHRIESLSSHEPELFAEAFNYSCWRDAMLEELAGESSKKKRNRHSCLSVI